MPVRKILYNSVIYQVLDLPEKEEAFHFLFLLEGVKNIEFEKLPIEGGYKLTRMRIHADAGPEKYEEGFEEEPDWQALKARSNLTKVEVTITSTSAHLRWRDRLVRYAVEEAVRDVPELKNMRVWRNSAMIRYGKEDVDRIREVLKKAGFVVGEVSTFNW